MVPNFDTFNKTYFCRGVEGYISKFLYSHSKVLDFSRLGVFFGGVTGRSETMCPRTKVLGPLIPKLIVPCETMSLD